MALSSVWHYTNGAGFHGLVTKHVLWATSFRHLNDSHEADYATTVLRKAAQDLRPSIPSAAQARFDQLMSAAERRGLNLFLLCAARKTNLLTVWRGYGGEVSYAVELDATVPLLPVERVAGDVHPFPPAGHEVEFDEHEGGRFVVSDPDSVLIESAGWLAVRYDTAGVEKRVQRMGDLAVRSPNTAADILGPWINLRDIKLLQLKNPDFKDEREARMIFEVLPRWKFVHHRDGRFGVTPYIQVSAESETTKANRLDNFLPEPGRLPIRSVMIGPTPLGQEIIDSTKEFLEFNGYPDVEVTKSEIPYR